MGNGEAGVILQGDTGNGVLIRGNGGTDSSLILTSNGNVGIGTTTPTTRLVVSNGSSGATSHPISDLTIEDDGSASVFMLSPNTAESWLGFGDPEDNDVGGLIYNHPANYMSLRVNAAEAMRLTSSGNVGIGTTTPSEALEVSGNIKLDGGTGSSQVTFGAPGAQTFPGLAWNNTTTGAGSVIAHSYLNAQASFGMSMLFNAYPTGNQYSAPMKRLRANYSPTRFTSDVHLGGGFDFMAASSGSADADITDWSTLVKITTAGNVGIGETSPGSKLSVSGGGSFGSGYDTTAAPSNGLIIQGNVGIGTASPGTKLHVYDSSAAPMLRVEATTNPAYLNLRNSNRSWNLLSDYTTGAFQIFDVTYGTPRVTVDTSGNVGIGTSAPAGKLTVKQDGGAWNDGIRIVEDGSSDYFDIMHDTLGLRIGRNDASIAMFSDAGNVGIGTTTPTSRLTVAGDVYITGALRDSTNSAGTTGYVLQTTGSGTQWVATSSLGFGSAITFGTDNQIPFMNSGGTDYDYSSNFTFDGTSLGIGTSTPQSLLTLQSAGTGNETLGLSQFHTLSPTVASTVSFGNELNITNAPTADNALLGSIIRITDNSTTSNIVRGIEIQTDVGLNTLGENTAVSAFARTLGVRGVTTADAGAFYEPAGLYGETEGTTQGNAIRGYSSSITTADLLTLYHDTSDFAGSGLVMNFANSSGSFNATSSQFLNLQNNNVTQFSVSARGTTTIGDGTTNNMAGLQIGYGGICVDNDGSCVASTTGNITSVSSSLGNSDVAELYFSSQELQPGELVVSDGFLSVSRAKKGADGLILGVVSTKPGLTLGYDDNSGVDNEKGYPLALAGRVPVRLSNENGVINQGDPLTLSSVPGVAMKAGSTDTFVGFALEAFDGTRAYSKGYVNQFGDDMVAPVLQNQAAATKVNKPCYFSGGAAVGETSDCDDDYVPISPDVQNDNQVATFNESQAALEQLLLEPATLIEINDGQTVAVGQVTMFVNRGTHFDDETRTALSQLVSTSTDDITKSTGGLSTVWERIRALAQSFVDGILHIAGIDVDRVDTKELCVDGVCITADDLRALINQSDSVPSTTGQQTDVERNVDPADESPGEPEADVDADAGAGDENSTDIPEETVPNQATGTTDTVIDDAADAVEGVDAPVDEGQSGVDTSSVESLEADVATGTPPTDSNPDVAAAPAADQDSAPIVNDSADTELTTIETETETEIVPEPIEPAESTPESSSAEITTN